MKIVPLIADGKENLWNDCSDHSAFFGEVGAPLPPVEHLEHIRQRGGEKLAAFDRDQIVGWTGVIPSPDSDDAELAGIEVHRDYRRQGIATTLLSSAITWASTRGSRRLNFQTSPLFTANTMLYMRGFNASYSWNGNNWADPERTVPWPTVDCSIEFADTAYRSSIMQGSDLRSQSVLTWTRFEPEIRRHIGLSGPTFEVMHFPELDLPRVFTELREGNTGLCSTTARVFADLAANHYQFRAFESVGNGFYAYVFQRAET